MFTQATGILSVVAKVFCLCFRQKVISEETIIEIRWGLQHKRRKRKKQVQRNHRLDKHKAISCANALADVPALLCVSCDILINRGSQRRSEAIKTNDTHMKSVDAKSELWGVKGREKRQRDIIMRNVNKCVTTCYRARAYYFGSLFLAHPPTDRRFSLWELIVRQFVNRIVRCQATMAISKDSRHRADVTLCQISKRLSLTLCSRLMQANSKDKLRKT